MVSMNGYNSHEEWKDSITFSTECILVDIINYIEFRDNQNSLIVEELTEKIKKVYLLLTTENLSEAEILMKQVDHEFNNFKKTE